MKMQKSPLLWAVAAICASASFLDSKPSIAQTRILFHGADVEATFGHDGDILTHLQGRFGVDNVTYMQGDMAAGDGSSADGFDAVLISATLNSGTVRNKYADIGVGVMNWEQAMTRQAAGEFNLSVGGRTNGGQTDITLLNNNHPISFGLPLETTSVLSAPHTMSFGTGDLGAGVTRIAAGTDVDNDHAILAAETGAELLGDGSPQSPAIAPARRVMFFLQDTGFTDLTPVGLQLFDNSVDYILGIDSILAGDFDENGVVDRADFEILRDNLAGHLDGPVGFSEGDINFDGRVDLRDFTEFKALPEFQAIAASTAIPEPATVAMAFIFLGGLAWIQLSRHRS